MVLVSKLNIYNQLSGIKSILHSKLPNTNFGETKLSPLKTDIINLSVKKEPQVVFDYNTIYDPIAEKRVGIIYYTLNRKPIKQDPGLYLPEYFQNPEIIDEKGLSTLKPHLYLDKVVIKPEMRGKGYFKKVLEKLIEVSKENGFEGRIALEAVHLKGEPLPPHNSYYSNGFTHGPSAQKKLENYICKKDFDNPSITKGKNGSWQFSGVDTPQIMCLKPENIQP